MGAELRAACTAGDHALSRPCAAGQDRAGTPAGRARCRMAPNAPQAGLMARLVSPGCGGMSLAPTAAASRGVDRASGAAPPAPANGAQTDAQPTARGAHGAHRGHRTGPPTRHRAWRARSAPACAVTPSRLSVLHRRPRPSAPRHLARRTVVYAAARLGGLRLRHAPTGRGRGPDRTAVRGDDAAV